jgi:hypothetical protein
VHASDIRKMFIWYNLVKDIVGSPEAEEVMREVLGEAAAEPESVAEVVAVEEAAPAPKTTRKKKAEPAAEVAEGEAPVKKARKTAKTKE